MKLCGEAVWWCYVVKLCAESVVKQCGEAVWWCCVVVLCGGAVWW